MTQLYKIANEYAELANNDDFEPEMIADTIEGIEGEFSQKLEQLIAVMKNNDGLAEMLKVEAKNLTDRAKKLSNKNDSIKQYIISSMNTMEKSKFNAGIHSLTVRKASKVLKVDNIDSLPPQFVEYETTAKALTSELKNRLKAGEKIEGARLEDGKQGLTIK